jgi:acetyl esterase/lipase
MRNVFFMVSALLLLCPTGCSQSGSSTNSSESYQVRRAKFQTKLIRQGPSPQEWADDPLPPNVSKVEYESAGRKLSAWVFRPEGSSAERRPALVYLHGGFAFGASDFTDCGQFADAGFVVMCPTFRGENGNAGDFEMMLGEVDDAAEAVRWIAQQEYVDPQQVFVFGHSSGGVMSAMLALYEDLPAQHTGSAGGMYGTDLFEAVGPLVPFDPQNAQETKIRIPIGNIRWMKRPHFAYVGSSDTFMRGVAAATEAKGAKAPLTVIELAGDHHTSLNPAMRQYLAVCRQAGK